MITSPIGLAWSSTKPNGERSDAEVELLRPPQPVLLGDREQDLEPDRRRALRVPRGELDQHRDRRLVVGAQDRLARGFDRRPRRGRPRSGRRAGPCPGGSRTSPMRRARRGSGRSGCRRRRAPPRPPSPRPTSTPELAQLGEHRVGDRALLPGRARDLAQPHEAIEHSLVVGHGSRLCACRRSREAKPRRRWSGAATPPRERIAQRIQLGRRLAGRARLRRLDGHRRADARHGRRPGTDLGTLGFYVTAWVVMMAAMMFPSICADGPHARPSRREARARPCSAGRSHGAVRRRLPDHLDGGRLRCYALSSSEQRCSVDRLAWDAAAPTLPAGDHRGAVYQLTPLKDVCLRKPQTRSSFLHDAWQPGR